MNLEHTAYGRILAGMVIREFYEHSVKHTPGRQQDLLLTEEQGIHFQTALMNAYEYLQDTLSGGKVQAAEFCATVEAFLKSVYVSIPTTWATPIDRLSAENNTMKDLIAIIQSVNYQKVQKRDLTPALHFLQWDHSMVRILDAHGNVVPLKMVMEAINTLAKKSHEMALEPLD